MKHTKPKNLSNRIEIRLSKKSDDIKMYSSMVQEACVNAYANRKLGLGKNLFSKKVFASQGAQEWLRTNLFPRRAQRTYLAFLKSRMVGAITVMKNKDNFVFKGFYVKSGLQGMGIGKLLFRRALKFANGKPVVLLMYPHNKKSLKMYIKWGFRRYGKAGYHHWWTWPNGVRMRYIYLRLANGANAIMLKKTKR